MELSKEFAQSALADALREGASGEITGTAKSSTVSKGAPLTRSLNEQNGTKLHGQRTPSYEIQREQPHHLAMAYMAAAAMSQEEIAQRTGFSRSHISQLFAQSWFVERVTSIIAEAGRDPVRELIKGATVDSVLRVVYLRDHAKSETVQLNSAKDLLDRHLGRASQPLDINDGSLKDPVAEAARLEREIAMLTATEKLIKERAQHVVAEE